MINMGDMIYSSSMLDYRKPVHLFGCHRDEPQDFQRPPAKCNDVYSAVCISVVSLSIVHQHCCFIGNKITIYGKLGIGKSQQNVPEESWGVSQCSTIDINRGFMEGFTGGQICIGLKKAWTREQLIACISSRFKWIHNYFLWSNMAAEEQCPLLLTWFNFNPSMDM